MKLLSLPLSAVSHYFIPVRSKYSPQHPVLKLPKTAGKVTEFEVVTPCSDVHLKTRRRMGTRRFWTASEH